MVEDEYLPDLPKLLPNPLPVQTQQNQKVPMNVQQTIVFPPNMQEGEYATPHFIYNKPPGISDAPDIFQNEYKLYQDLRQPLFEVLFLNTFKS